MSAFGALHPQSTGQRCSLFKQQSLVVVVVRRPGKPLGSSPDAWLALEIACSVLKTPRPTAFSRLKPAGRRDLVVEE